MRAITIYDCFMFYNELDILEIRLNVLNSTVDKFVLVEAAQTHTGLPKKLYYQESAARFDAFQDKIIHIVYDGSCEQIPAVGVDTRWYRENMQRDALMRGLVECRSNDVVLVSDVDEIPDPHKIAAYKDVQGIKVFEQRMMYYYLNFQQWDCPIWRQGTRMGAYADLLSPQVEPLPNPAHSWSKPGLPTYFRFCPGTFIPEGGWHFSYCGDAEFVANKRKSIVEGDFFRNVANLEDCIKKGRDIYGRPHFFRAVPLDESFPKYIRDNQGRYGKLILQQTAKEKYFSKIYSFQNLVFWYFHKWVTTARLKGRSTYLRLKRLVKYLIRWK